MKSHFVIQEEEMLIFQENENHQLQKSTIQS